MMTSISADIEASYRAMIKDFSGSVSTTDGGTMWGTFKGITTTTSTATETYRTTFEPLTSWSPIGFGKSIRLNEAQQAMVLDAICEQIIHQPPPSLFTHKIVYPGLTISGSGSTSSIEWGSWSYDET